MNIIMHRVVLYGTIIRNLPSSILISVSNSSLKHSKTAMNVQQNTLDWIETATNLEIFRFVEHIQK